MSEINKPKPKGTILSKKMVKARKEYDCLNCYNKINKGDTYQSMLISGGNEQNAYPWKLCNNCKE